MIRLPDSDDAEDSGQEVIMSPFETSKSNIHDHKPRKTPKWRFFICIAILIAFSVLIIRAFLSPSHRRPAYSGNQSGSVNLLQASKVQDPNIHNKTWRGDYAKRVLCKILEDESCQSSHIADVIDLAWVIAPIYCLDPDADWKLLELHGLFKDYIQSLGLNFITIEAIRFPGDEAQRPWSKEAKKYTQTVPGNEPYDIQVYYYNVSYIRENLLNVAIRKLDKQKPWEYAIWIDAHQFLENPYWWEESIYKMEKYASVQLFGSIQYVGDDNKTELPPLALSAMRSSLLTDAVLQFNVVYGNAFGLRKDLYHAVGYLYDECIATSCDCAWVLSSFPDGVGFAPLFPAYYKNFDNYINSTKKVLKGNRAFVPGHMLHFSHGWGFPYKDVEESVGSHGFNASLHIKRDQNFSVYIDYMEFSSDLDRIILDYKRKYPLAH